MKVKLTKDLNFDIKEVDVPHGVIKEWATDYKDTKGIINIITLIKQVIKRMRNSLVAIWSSSLSITTIKI